MIWPLAKILIAGILISFSAWLADRKPILAGFVVALPLTTILALSLNYLEFGDLEKSRKFALAIAVAVPLSLTFFVPFLLAKKLQWPFWSLMASGLVFLTLSFFVHQWLFRLK